MLKSTLEAIAEHPFAFCLLCLGLNVVLSGLRTALVKAGGNLFGLFRVVKGPRQ